MCDSFTGMRCVRWTERRDEMAWSLRERIRRRVKVKRQANTKLAIAARWPRFHNWYRAEMMTDPIEFPIFQMELADTILRKVRRK